jgi:hypothetical protein
VQHLVRALLDNLAPERPPARASRPLADVQLVRSPRGCILQATTRAVSVSWFAASASEPTLGELQVILWDGVVSRPGSASPATGGASPLWEVLFRPREVVGESWGWATADGVVSDTATLAARCHALLADDAVELTPDKLAGAAAPTTAR